VLLLCSAVLRSIASDCWTYICCYSLKHSVIAHWSCPETALQAVCGCAKGTHIASDLDKLSAAALAHSQCQKITCLPNHPIQNQTAAKAAAAAVQCCAALNCQ
jgi:hypothetical protein